MSMPRPSGRAQKIAEDTIPGLNKNNRSSRKRSVKKDDVETTTVKNNEKMGMNLWKKRKR